MVALNLVAWNNDELSHDLLGEVLLGASDVAKAGGFVIAGGHTVDDPEPKFGLAVIGEVNPDRLLTNTGLQPGQVLVLTKPLGIGVVSTAIKAGKADDALVEAAVASMTRLNDQAAAVAVEAGATGATDVTGFGLLGHLSRAAAESGVDVTIDVASVPVLDGVRPLADQGLIPGGTRRNLRSIEERLDVGPIPQLDVLLLADAQTSGGLVFGVAPHAVDPVLAALDESGHGAAAIGRTERGDGMIHLR